MAQELFGLDPRTGASTCAQSPVAGQRSPRLITRAKIAVFRLALVLLTDSTGSLYSCRGCVYSFCQIHIAVTTESVVIGLITIADESN